MKKFLFFFFVTSHLFYAQTTYISTADDVNVREQPNKNSIAIGKLNKGEEVQVININSDWAKIRYQNGDYYIASQFIDKSQKNSKNEIDLGFKDGFVGIYMYSTIILSAILISREKIRKRTRDNRYAIGYRQGKVSELSIFKCILIGIIGSLPIALLGAIICWIL